MARRGHRVLSGATKAKIAASLRGNKNAFRGGPKKQRLTQRQKVANINARTKANKANLSDAQIRQRSAVAKRLRARARAEEAGIQPAHSKPIPTPDTITQRDSKLRADASRVRGSIAKIETHSSGVDNHTASKEQKAAARLASGKGQYAQGFLTASQKAEVQRLQREGKHNAAGAVAHNAKNQSQGRIAQHVAALNSGKGNFNNNNQKLIDVNNKGIAKRNEEIGRLLKSGSSNESHLQNLLDEVGALHAANKDLASASPTDVRRNRIPKANRAKPSTDPLTKATSKPRTFPKASPDSVKNAYKKVAKRNQEFVPLTQVRQHLGGSRSEQDATIAAMHRAGGLHLSPESSNKRHDAAYSSGAIKIGKNVNHLVAMEEVFQPHELK